MSKREPWEDFRHNDCHICDEARGGDKDKRVAAAIKLCDMTGTDHDLADLDSQVEVVGQLLRMKDERIAALEALLHWRSHE